MLCIEHDLYQTYSEEKKHHMKYKKEKKPSIAYFHQFGCAFYILNNKVYLKKFDDNA